MDFILYRNDIIKNHDKKGYNIAFCADDNYIKYVGVSIFSILENNPDLMLNFHLFVTEIAEEDKEKLRNISSNSKNFNLSVYYINTDFFKDLPISEHFSTAIYYRLVIPYVLYNEEYVLYLDTDIICLGGIAEIFEIRTEKTISVIEDHLISKEYLYSLEEVGFSIKPYFNSGVLFINNKRWVKLKIFEGVLGFIKNNNFKYPDQDALNLLLQDDKNIISKKFNFIEWEETYYNKKLNDIILLHFIGGIKPWYAIGEHPLYDLYLKSSPWKDIEYILPETTSDFRRASTRLWKIGRKKKAIKYKLLYVIRKLSRKK